MVANNRPAPRQRLIAAAVWPDVPRSPEVAPVIGARDLACRPRGSRNAPADDMFHSHWMQGACPRSARTRSKAASKINNRRRQTCDFVNRCTTMAAVAVRNWSSQRPRPVPVVPTAVVVAALGHPSAAAARLAPGPVGGHARETKDCVSLLCIRAAGAHGGPYYSAVATSCLGRNASGRRKWSVFGGRAQLDEATGRSAHPIEWPFSWLQCRGAGGGCSKEAAGAPRNEWIGMSVVYVFWH
jgi:hypothetical protein